MALIPGGTRPRPANQPDAPIPNGGALRPLGTTVNGANGNGTNGNGTNGTGSSFSTLNDSERAAALKSLDDALSGAPTSETCCAGAGRGQDSPRAREKSGRLLPVHLRLRWTSKPPK